MKYLPMIVLGTLTLFFGIYSLILELKYGVNSNRDQMIAAFLFGILTFMARS